MIYYFIVEEEDKIQQVDEKKMNKMNKEIKFVNKIKKN